MRQGDGKLLHAYKDGRARFNGMLDDYADLIDGLVRLFEADGDARWIESALDLSKILIDEFLDVKTGGFYFTGENHEALIARQKDVFDNATPSGNAMAATALSRLSALTGREDLHEIAREILGHVQAIMERADGGGPIVDRTRFHLASSARMRRDFRVRSKRVPRGLEGGPRPVSAGNGRRAGVENTVERSGSARAAPGRSTRRQQRNDRLSLRTIHLSKASRRSVRDLGRLRAPRQETS